MSQKELVTKDGLEILQSKISDLEQKLAELRLYKGEEAVHAGDSWHDNPTLYRVEAEERSLMFQISQLKEKLSRVEIVQTAQDNGSVAFGCKVEIEFSDGFTESYRILSEAEANPSLGIVSYKSPLGSALIGKRVGDKVAYKVGDNSEEVKILSITL